MELRGTITVELTRDEVTFLCNAVNETLEAIENWEFETRTGAKPEEARVLHSKLKMLLSTD